MHTIFGSSNYRMNVFKKSIRIRILFLETYYLLFDIGCNGVANFGWDSELTIGDNLLKPVGEGSVTTWTWLGVIKTKLLGVHKGIKTGKTKIEIELNGEEKNRIYL